jgi:hypothetical protein
VQHYCRQSSLLHIHDPFVNALVAQPLSARHILYAVMPPHLTICRLQRLTAGLTVVSICESDFCVLRHLIHS